MENKTNEDGTLDIYDGATYSTSDEMLTISDSQICDCDCTARKFYSNQWSFIK